MNDRTNPSIRAESALRSQETGDGKKVANDLLIAIDVLEKAQDSLEKAHTKARDQEARIAALESTLRTVLSYADGPCGGCSVPHAVTEAAKAVLKDDPVTFLGWTPEVRSKANEPQPYQGEDGA